MSPHHAAAQRNMRLVVGLLESIPEQGLTDVEWEFLNSLILGARLLCSAVISRQAEPAESESLAKKILNEAARMTT